MTWEVFVYGGILFAVGWFVADVFKMVLAFVRSRTSRYEREVEEERARLRLLLNQDHPDVGNN